VLYAGVERPVIALEATIAIGLVATVGPRLVTLLAVGLIVGVVHPVMAWLTSKDPLATAVYVRSLAWRDYYAPQGGVRARGRVRPTLPRV
jgi:type IV secretory pathway TrbD component